MESNSHEGEGEGEGEEEVEVEVEEKPQINNNSSSSEETVRTQPPPPPAATTYIGKHRLAAAVSQLNHQIQIIQEELDELESLGHSSLVCEELVTTLESIPDPLLPEINGPPVVGWDRWFQGGSRARKRWI